MTDKLLYHYTSFDSFKSIINSKSFRLYSSDCMDDMHDKKYSYYCIKSAIKQSEYGDALFNLKDVPFLDTIPTHYTMSFCTIHNEYLWNHYASKHQGICIVLNRDVFERLYESQKSDINRHDPNIFRFSNMQYGRSNAYIESVARDLFELFHPRDRVYNSQDDWRKKNANVFYLIAINQVCRGMIKRMKYEPENEYRLVYADLHEELNKFTDPTMKIMRGLSLERRENLISKYGMEKSIDSKGRQFKLLQLGSIMSDDLIPEIIVGKCFSNDVKEVKDILENNDLGNTKITASS